MRARVRVRVKVRVRASDLLVTANVVDQGFACNLPGVFGRGWRTSKVQERERGGGGAYCEAVSNWKNEVCPTWAITS